MAVDMDILGYIPQGLAVLAGALSQHPNFTFIWFKKTQDQTDQGGFSSAVGADNSDKIVLPDG